VIRIPTGARVAPPFRMDTDEAIEAPPAAVVSLSEPLLAAQEVATLLAVPRSSVYEYARRRHAPLPSIRIGRHMRFYRSDVERWLADQRGRPLAARTPRVVVTPDAQAGAAETRPASR
jgi:excisionase family DNA binding protein